MTTYGDFPGVVVEVASGGITSVAIGGEETLVLFGEANYEDDNTLQSDGTEDAISADASPEDPVQVNARSESDLFFGAGSELAEGMRAALTNGANIDFLYGVAPRRFNATETQATQTEQLNNAPIWEEDVSDDSNITAVEFDDNGTILDVRLTYESPTAPTDADTVELNPLTGEYAADSAPDTDFDVSYKYLDWESAFTDSSVESIIQGDDTGIYVPLTDADSVSATLDNLIGQEDGYRDTYKLISALSGAEPNDNEEVTDSQGDYVRNDARYLTSDYANANQSVDSDFYFKVAPARLENTADTLLGGVGGLFAGNDINNPIYNDQVLGYESLEQSFTKADEDNMRGENVIPIRQAGSIRVKDNISTSTETGWERDFWRRRIVDRVILIAKTIGDNIIGRVNDDDTREAAARMIRAEIREMVGDRLLRPNEAGNERWYVDVYESSVQPDEVKIDIAVTPYDIVKRVDASVTIDT